ncbi:protein trichome birefringence-like [Rhododendron vialii]|uniref:protein trichome birefringence-like n=1 Tax=Rhododendron vialii TaxID=182163 RepID=UPI00265E0C52|nr:protein trichome birefringence-like [Rhododendron vialii]XP_058204849.1 protein trichome birefringence-like [Rhododendron vialii]
MADATKQASINGGSLLSELKTLFSLLKNKKTKSLAFFFISAFIAFTVFLAFNPSSNSSSPWFNNIFSTFTYTSTNASSISTFSPDKSNRSHFPTILSYFFPNSSQQTPSFAPNPSPTKPSSRSQNPTFQSPTLNNPKNQTHSNKLHDKVEVFSPNQSTIGAPNSTLSTNYSSNPVPNPSSERKNISGSDKERVTKKGVTQKEDKAEVFKPNQSTIGLPKSPVAANQSSNSAPKSKSSPERENNTGNEEKRVAQKGAGSNFSSSIAKKKQSNGTNNSDGLVKQRSENLVGCDLFDGEWVKDESYPLYKPGSCSLIDEQFNCFVNGRPDNGYLKLKWKPKGCSLPRLNGSHMLELLRGKRLVFVGDSLNRNMWESLVCILRNSVKDQSKVYEASGRHHFRTEASYSFVFKDYDCTVEFFVSPFLVQEWEMPDKNGSKKETLRLDRIGISADQYKTADIIIFNTGHWWTHEKTSKGKDYYQEGTHVYGELNVVEAFRKALTTWARWVDANISPMKSHVLFRGYSASHFSGGQWNSGGQCDSETEPIRNDTFLRPYPPKMAVLESVLKGMKTRVSYLNITRITDYRKDGHPSIYRKQSFSEEERRSPLSFQDCSHWCLPGVPDAWNELLYAELLRKKNQRQKQHKMP